MASDDQPVAWVCLESIDDGRHRLSVQLARGERHSVVRPPATEGLGNGDEVVAQSV